MRASRSSTVSRRREVSISPSPRNVRRARPVDSNDDALHDASSSCEIGSVTSICAAGARDAEPLGELDQPSGDPRKAPRRRELDPPDVGDVKA